MTHGSARRNSLCLLMTGAWQRKNHAFSLLFRHAVFMRDIKHEYRSFISLSRTCTGQFAVNCGYHVHRYCYIHSMETLQSYERWRIVVYCVWKGMVRKNRVWKHFKLSKTNSIERLICLAVLPKKNCYGQASIRENSATRKRRKWSIWRILLICLTSQLTHKSTICIFRDLLQLLWFRKRKKWSTLKLHPCNLWIEKKTGIADKIKKEVGTALLKAALYSRSQNCTPRKQENKWRNHAFYRLF